LAAIRLIADIFLLHELEKEVKYLQPPNEFDHVNGKRKMCVDSFVCVSVCCRSKSKCPICIKIT